MSVLVHPHLPEPQQQRAIATRQRLIEAAVESLVAHGYAGATTTVIARQAGVSQGALYKHFPAKPLLLASAAEWVFAALRREFMARLTQHAIHGAGQSADLDVLWGLFVDPRLQGILELYSAARTDTALSDMLQPIVDAHFAAIGQIAREVFPEAALNNPDFDGVVRSVLMMMQGAALMLRVLPGGGDISHERAFIARLVRTELGEPRLFETGRGRS